MSAIRERRKAGGTVVYDAHAAVLTVDGRRSSIHLGTFDRIADARAVIDEWRLAGIRDQELRRERAEKERRTAARLAHQDGHCPRLDTGGLARHCPTCDELEGELVRRATHGFGHARTAGWWPSDPTGDTAAANVDRERTPRRSMTDIETTTGDGRKPVDIWRLTLIVHVRVAAQTDARRLAKRLAFELTDWDRYPDVVGVDDAYGVNT